MKYLIVGLGNIGYDYAETRHNIGFMILEAFAKASNVFFTDNRYGSICEIRILNKSLILLKPSTFMNLSGNAVRYWMQKEKIELKNILIVVDDLALPFGALRIKGKGSDAGHNGLRHIQETIGTQSYSRLRFGIGDNYTKGSQVNYVLGKFSTEENLTIDERINMSIDIIKSFCLSGLNVTMNQYNNK